LSICLAFLWTMSVWSLEAWSIGIPVGAGCAPLLADLHVFL
jgi:hypothetical protein